MLCSSHLHHCAHRNPERIMVLVDILAMLTRNDFAHEHTQASQLANPESSATSVLGKSWFSCGGCSGPCLRVSRELWHQWFRSQPCKG